MRKLIIFPLYPQYASPTTATVCDEVFRSLMKMRWQPAIKIIPHYGPTAYTDAIVNSINKKMQEIDWRPDLVVVYHGIPRSILIKVIPIIVTVKKPQG